MAFAHQIGAPGTPTVIIEGWMLPFTPGPDLMQALVREFVARERLRIDGAVAVQEGRCGGA